nr:immunoglobulin heavy chain junction region [Macaca mulatta]
CVKDMGDSPLRVW